MKFYLNFYILFMLWTLPSLCFAQTTNISNTFSNGSYLGWNSSVNFPLKIMTQNTKPIIFKTNGIQRMIITEKGDIGIPHTTLTTNAKLTVSAERQTITVRTMYQSDEEINVASKFHTNDGNANIAVHGEAIGSSVLNKGITGIALGATHNYGIYAKACIYYSNSLAGLFNGDINVVNAWSPSDESLKSDIQDLTSALFNLMQLEVKAYNFIENPYLQLPQDLQYGIMAQSLLEVYPNCVKSITAPTFEKNMLDESIIKNESIEFKAVNYKMLIPLLVAGFKQQDDVITQQFLKINVLLDRLNTLENSISAKATIDSLKSINAQLSFELDQNYPNPFNNQTYISYSITQPSKVNIYIQNSNYETIYQIINEMKPEGSYSTNWVAPLEFKGIVYCVMEVNGQKIVRKMLKL